MESDAQLVASVVPTGVRLGSDQETYLAIQSPSPFINATVALDVCFGSLSCCKSARDQVHGVMAASSPSVKISTLLSS